MENQQQTRIDVPEWMEKLVVKLVAEQRAIDEQIANLVALYLKASNVSGNWAIAKNGQYLLQVKPESPPPA